MIRKAALQIGVPVLLAFIAGNAFLAINHLRRVQNIAARTLESSAIQTEISDVSRDLTDMETGQRGYLLTGDETYLQPYSEAKSKIETDLARLRGGLSARSFGEQSMESQLESLSKSKLAEVEHSIDLRQQGYRHRSFMLVNTNEGKDYMDKIRVLLSSLSEAENGRYASLRRENQAAVKTAFSRTILTNCALLLLTACLFVLIRRNLRQLEEDASRSKIELATRDLQLEKLTSALSGRARSSIVAINTNSRLLLENYGDFLPRQGHEYAEQMNEAAAEMELLRQDLVGCKVSEMDEQAA